MRLKNPGQAAQALFRSGCVRDGLILSSEERTFRRIRIPAKTVWLENFHGLLVKSITGVDAYPLS